MNVLVTDGGNGQNRSAVAAVRALSGAGYRPYVSVSGGRSLAAASRHCAGAVAVPRVDDPSYAASVCRAAAGFVAVLPASDAAMVALGQAGAVLVDKTAVSARAHEAGLPVLPELVYGDWRALLAAAGDLEYPIVVKPVARAAGQPPVRRIDTPRELRATAPSGGPQVVQRCVAAPLTAVAGVIWQGELVAVVHQRYERIWPPAAGVACALETVEGDRDLEEPLRQVLRGHDGVFQAQFVGPYLMDVNPRVYGSLPAAVAAGANLPAVYCDLLRGCDVAHVRGRAGVSYRWVEGDLRHLVTRRRAGELSTGECLRALRPRRGTAHSTESLADPGPAFARLRYVLTRQTATRWGLRGGAGAPER